VLKFVETVFGLPTLASINHLFDKSTPKVNNQANGAPFPPRDGNPAISDLTQCFTFGCLRPIGRSGGTRRGESQHLRHGPTAGPGRPVRGQVDPGGRPP
jgi:hypothetical protein